MPRRAAIVAAGHLYRVVLFDGPIVINSGGTYSGNWESTDPDVPVITVATTQPVTIQNSRLRGRGTLIRATAGNADLTVQNSYGYGLNPGVAGRTPGRFVDAEEFAAITITNNHIENNAGIYLLTYEGSAADTNVVSILRNRVRNINGRASTGAGYSNTTADIVQFAQLDKVVSGGIEIAWNDVVNDPGIARTEDVINIYDSGGFSSAKLLIHDNYINGSYPEDVSVSDFSGGGIIVEGGTDAKWVECYDNHVLATVNYGIAIAGGHDNFMHANRVVSSGLFPNGTVVPAQNIGAYVWNIDDFAGFANNRIDDNTIGWYQAHSLTRNNAWFPDCPVGGCDTNTILKPGEIITLADEADETLIWSNKVAAAEVVIGPDFAF